MILRVKEGCGKYVCSTGRVAGKDTGKRDEHTGAAIGEGAEVAVGVGGKGRAALRNEPDLPSAKARWRATFARVEADVSGVFRLHILGILLGMLVTPCVFAQERDWEKACVDSDSQSSNVFFDRNPFVHPRILDDLTGYWPSTADGHIVAIGLSESKNSERYKGEVTIRERDPDAAWQGPWVYWYDGEDNGKVGFGGTPFFAYRYIGVTKREMHVLHTKVAGGGAIIGHDVVLVAIRSDARHEYSDRIRRDCTQFADTRADDGGEAVTFPRSTPRQVVTVVGHISLGDRWEGRVDVVANDVVVHGYDIDERCENGMASARDVATYSITGMFECTAGDWKRPPAEIFRASGPWPSE